MPPFFVVLVFLEVDNLQSSKDEQYELILALLDVILACSLGSPLCLIFSQCCPELKRLSSYLVIGALCSCCRHLTRLFKVQSNIFIFLCPNLSQTVQSALLDLLVWRCAGGQDFGHNEVSFLLHLEIWSREWHTMQKSFDSESGWFWCCFSVHDVVGKRQDDVVLECIVQILGMELLTDISERLE